MSESLYLVFIVLAMTVVTFAIRAVPFVLGSHLLQKQKWIRHFGEFLPLSIMVLLILGSLFDTVERDWKLGVAGVLSVSLVVGLQWRFKRPLLSIFSGAILFIAFSNGWISSISF